VQNCVQAVEVDLRIGKRMTNASSMLDATRCHRRVERACMVLEQREDTGVVDVEMDPVDMARVSEVIHSEGQRCGFLDLS